MDFMCLIIKVTNMHCDTMYWCMSTNVLKKPAPFNFRVTLSTTQRGVTYQTTVIIIFQICSVSNTRKRSI